MHCVPCAQSGRFFGIPRSSASWVGLAPRSGRRSCRAIQCRTPGAHSGVCARANPREPARWRISSSRSSFMLREPGASIESHSVPCNVVPRLTQDKVPLQNGGALSETARNRNRRKGASGKARGRRSIVSAQGVQLPRRWRMGRQREEHREGGKLGENTLAYGQKGKGR